MRAPPKLLLATLALAACAERPLPPPPQAPPLPPQPQRVERSPVPELVADDGPPPGATPVVLRGIPHVRQKPDFCGEACAEMVLAWLGRKGTQDDVFDLSGIDPALGRGAITPELKRGLERLGFRVGDVWYPVQAAHAAAELSRQFANMYADLAREVMRDFSGLEARFITGLSRSETLSAVERVDPGSLVVYLTMLRDGTGQTAGPGSDTVTQVAAHSAAPVLAASHTQFGRGPVGGSSARFDAHGSAAGRIARRLIEGADPDLIPVAADPEPDCAVDWRTLGRWRLDEARIPAGCEVTGRPVSAMDTYLRPVLALVCVILLQAGLIWALWAQSRRRRAAEADSQRRRTEIAHVARLSVMGVVTASIAHEINQPLGAILSNADAADLMLRNGNVDCQLLREILADIRSEDLRASEVIRGLRLLLRKREMRNAVLDVNTEVAEALHHVAHDAGRRHVRVIPEFAVDLPAVVGDAVHLQQVMINLVVNAMDAMDATPDTDREVRVETSVRGRGVEIAVADRGTGITSEHAAQLFDSFFTTKPEGMGLGLSIVRTIVEAHGGRVWADSSVLRGAIFRVWLPAAGTA